ncbi:MAG: lipocalin family protein [Chitinophagaceae bacterium]|jgi:hypothetical protein|nr:lipocalin family protein [Chitinophagaceae bacterium]
MKKTAILFRTVILLAITTLMVRCSDDEEQKSPAELIVGIWSLTGDAVSPPIDLGGGPISDFYPYYEPCEKDDVIIVNAGNTGEYNEGATKCDPGDDQAIPFTWALTNNNTVLVVDGYSFTILQLDETTLKLQIKETVSGTQYTYTTTYVRK